MTDDEKANAKVPPDANPQAGEGANKASTETTGNASKGGTGDADTSEATGGGAGSPPQPIEPTRTGDADTREATGGGAGSPPQPIEPTVVLLNSYTKEELRALYEQLEIDYNAILNEFLDSSNAYVEDFKKYRSKYTKWRICMLVLTGGLAILNILAAQKLGGDLYFLWWPLEASQFVSLVAAVYAAVLALLANVETFLNYSDAKAGSRLSRELFLDAYREYRTLWYTYVRPFGYHASACINATILLRKVVAKDTEIRRKVKEADRETSAPAK
jgi:hypothetical protein